MQTAVAGDALGEVVGRAGGAVDLDEAVEEPRLPGSVVLVAKDGV